MPLTVSGPLQGALWMVLACLLFMVMSAMIRQVSDTLPAFQIIAIRNVFSLLTILPLLLRVGRVSFRAWRPGLLFGRALLMIGAMTSWIVAVEGLDLATATSISFSSPLFATAGAALFLKEQVGPRRWAAVVVGFAGMLIILRPGLAEMSAAAGFALANALLTAWGGITVKVLTRTESTATVVLYLYLLTTPLSAIPAIFVWVPPTALDVGWLAVMGVLVALGHICLTKAYAAAEASAILPYDFAKVVFAALLGFTFFGELPDAGTWIGMFVIFAATVYMARHEAQVARAKRIAAA